jgi:multidrug resistance efflux pump
MTFGRWVSVAMLVFTAFLLLFGWIIKYPDTVTGQIRINSDLAPIKLVANISGNLHLEDFRPQDEVAKGDYIAVIENPAVTVDIRKVLALVSQFNPNESPIVYNKFPEKVSLGDLNLKYYAFLTALKNRADYEKDNIFEKQRVSLSEDIKWNKSLLNESNDLLAIVRQKMEISQKWLEKYVSLNKKEVVTYDYEVDRSKSDYLLAKQEELNYQKGITSILMQIRENENQLNQLKVEQQEKERQLQMELLTSFHDLNDNFKSWEQKYVFKAPFPGQVEFLKFLSENQFVHSGEEVFGIIPKESNIFGQVLLPSGGAGKVKIGSRVTIKLDNYPYMEYGSVEGRVNSISLLSQPRKSEQQTIETYLLVVELPKGLLTNYGERLEFRHEIGGTADIIVKERRLIERLFDNLKYRTKDK